MNEGLRELFDHNAWANAVVLEYCRGLADDVLAATDDAVYGDVLATMHHLLDAEGFYSGMFLDRFQPWHSTTDPTRSVDKMLGWAADVASAWDEVLSRPVDPDAVLVLKREGRPDRQHRAGMLLTQALHHGNVHREQVCHILTSLGLEPPDVSAWRWDREK
jgi:uncharacterized damage-inducible protein DinB